MIVLTELIILLWNFPANTVCQMIVDKTWSLQMGVANRSSEELETSFFHIFTTMASDSGEDTGISLNDRNVLDNSDVFVG